MYRKVGIQTVKVAKSIIANQCTGPKPAMAVDNKYGVTCGVKKRSERMFAFPRRIEGVFVANLPDKSDP